jgi:putative ABC transport system substrate-binding protein
MTTYIGRRQFITVLGGAAAWPLAARAQQPNRVRRIGVLMGLPATDSEAPIRVAALLQRLQELGWTDRRNVRVDYRLADNENSVQKAAAELIALAMSSRSEWSRAESSLARSRML